MKNLFLVIAFFIIFCNCNNNKTTLGSHTQNALDEDTVLPERTNPNPKPAASFSENITSETGKLNNWKFRVNLYETHKTFMYRMEIQYAELNITDSLQLPDLAIEPKPVLQKGKDAYSCIIGFMDNKNIFREYKLVAVTNGNLRIHTLKYYSVYRTSRTQ